MRKSYLDKVAAIKESTKGLDCKTEAELDAKIRAQVHGAPCPALLAPCPAGPLPCPLPCPAGF